MASFSLRKQVSRVTPSTFLSSHIQLHLFLQSLSISLHKVASCRRTKSERGIFTQKTIATGWSCEISYRSAKTRCKILSSARGCSLLAVCVNLSCLFKNKLGLIFFCGLVFFSRILKLRFHGNPRIRGKMGALAQTHRQSRHTECTNKTLRPSSQFHTAVSWVTPKAKVSTDTQTDRHTECTHMTLRPSSHFHTVVSWVTPQAEVSSTLPSWPGSILMTGAPWHCRVVVSCINSIIYILTTIIIIFHGSPFSASLGAGVVCWALSYLMQRHGFHPPLRRIFPVERIFPLELP